MSEAWKILGIAIARTARFVVPFLAAVAALTPEMGWAQNDSADGDSLLAQGEESNAGETIWARVTAAWAWLAAVIPWETMFGLVQIKGVAEGLAFAILAVLGLTLIPFAWIWGRDWIVLRTFIGKVQAVPNEPYGFADRRRDLDADILGMSGKQFDRVKHAWREFHKSVFTEKDAAEKILAYNTVPPENFFTPEKLGMNFAFFRALSGYFVGVGLLLTFFGLAAALFYANKSIAEGGGEVSKTQDALRLLLNAATLKFMTSITGLFSSIVLSAAALIAGRHMSRLCADICKELEMRVEFAAQELLAMKQLRELRKQTTQLEKFSTDLAVSIAEQIAEPVSAGVLDALGNSGLLGLTATLGKLDNVKNKLETLAGDIAGKVEEPVRSGVASGVGGLKNKIEDLAGKIVQGGKEGVDEITRGIPEKIQLAANTINAASQQLANATGQLKSVAEGLQSQVRNAGTALGKSLEGASGEVGRKVLDVGDRVTKLDNAVGKLGRMLDEQRAKFQDLSRATFQDLSRATQSAAAALDSAAVKHAQAAQPIADAASRIENAANTIRNLGELVGETHQSLENLHKHIKDSNAELRQFWEQHDGRFAGVDERLGAVVQKILDSNKDYQGSVSNFVTELANKLESALGQLSAAIQELGEIADDWRDGRK